MAISWEQERSIAKPAAPAKPAPRRGRNAALMAWDHRSQCESGNSVETLIAVAVAVGVIKGPAPATPPAEPPKLTCAAGWQRTADGCVREKPKAPSKSEWQIAY
jgi:hypothetical protein